VHNLPNPKTLKIGKKKSKFQTTFSKINSQKSILSLQEAPYAAVNSHAVEFYHYPPHFHVFITNQLQYINVANLNFGFTSTHFPPVLNMSMLPRCNISEFVL
jgi:hypothetical protein